MVPTSGLLECPEFAIHLKANEVPAQHVPEPAEARPEFGHFGVLWSLVCSGLAFLPSSCCMPSMDRASRCVRFDVDLLLDTLDCPALDLN